ncbi:site-specific recombinase [Herbaspirillum sp. LeCh32-8]|uniref:site-specific recombinase n=1 Tax=Herbaspirillum sp. LeCh32-8 TaxID=2821356 RepID=UPI001AEB2EC3|nr:site-specific recombinase [Herbaspirillum sp. LeCh32-8]MBP0599474.1 site-specific recombinase [Herbaspirillum sp. LeCh32-8]
MLPALEHIASDPLSTELSGIAALAASLRPPRKTEPQAAAGKVRALAQLLRDRPELAAALRSHLLHLLSTRRQVSLYTDTGIFSNDGFFHELRRRIAYRVLPPALDERNLQDCLDIVFPHEDDYLWLQAVPFDDWEALWQAVAGAALPEPLHQASASDRGKTLTELLQAIQVLSYRISAIGTQPELVRVYSDVKAFESPFLMQNVELHGWLESYRRRLQDETAPMEDTRHVLVLLDQCQEVIDRIRKQTLRIGTSVSLTYRMLRLEQTLQRLRQLLALAEPHAQAITAADKALAGVGAGSAQQRRTGLALGLELVEAHNRKYTLRGLLAGNINLLARNITENASRTGEHYIADNRREFGAMYRSAAGAGFIIGFMAMIKILFSYLHAAPLVEAFLYSMNYSLGFMLIHVLHFTVATKQPAMTASRIAADLHRSGDGRNLDIDSLVDVIVKVFRTQFIAVLGNLTIAFPVAYLLAAGYFGLAGTHFVDADKAGHLLHDLDPIGSLALFHAAIAGVCLFLAGLISGYYDNKALYTRMAQRVVRARWLTGVIGRRGAQKLGTYLETGLGGLMGNFYFGIMLGTIGTVGFLLGLPIDIRHITFSAANLAIAMEALQWHVGMSTFVLSAAGVLAVGAVNLWVSFSLALFVALRSRQVRFRQGGKLVKALLSRLLKNPGSFFWPPKDLPADAATTDEARHP